MDALGLVSTIDVAADLVEINEVVQPDPAAAQVYADLRPTFDRLYDELVPTFRALLRPGQP
jgi:gluconokinase